jgi:methionyl-tRNA formyltransferase
MTEAVRPTDTSGALLDRLAIAGADLLVATLNAIEDGTVTAEPQPADGVSTAPKLSPAQARIDWTVPALRVDRQVRACTPAPGAWTELRGERLGLGPVRLAEQSSLDPGQVRVEKGRVLVGAGDGRAVELGDVRPAGKRMMPAADWARGVRDLDGERLH